MDIYKCQANFSSKAYINGGVEDLDHQELHSKDFHALGLAGQKFEQLHQYRERTFNDTVEDRAAGVCDGAISNKVIVAEICQRTGICSK